MRELRGAREGVGGGLGHARLEGQSGGVRYGGKGKGASDSWSSSPVLNFLLKGGSWGGERALGKGFKWMVSKRN